MEHALFMVHISITFNSGTFVVDGDHNYWIKNEFPKVAEVFKEQREYDKGEATDEKLRDKMSTSIDCLWLKNEELKAALENQDEVIAKIINRCQNIELKTNEIKPKLITLEAEKAFDNKLLLFMNFMYEEFEKSINTLKNEFNTQIRKLEKQIDTVNKDLAEKINNIGAFNDNTPSEATNKPENKLEVYLKEQNANISEMNNKLEKMNKAISIIDEKTVNCLKQKKIQHQ